MAAASCGGRNPHRQEVSFRRRCCRLRPIWAVQPECFWQKGVLWTNQRSWATASAPTFPAIPPSPGTRWRLRSMPKSLHLLPSWNRPQEYRVPSSSEACSIWSTSAVRRRRDGPCGQGSATCPRQASSGLQKRMGSRLCLRRCISRLKAQSRRRDDSRWVLMREGREARSSAPGDRAAPSSDATEQAPAIPPAASGPALGWASPA